MPIDRIVIAGGGVAGWMAASMLARALEGTTTAIRVIEHDEPDDSLGIVTPAETMSPRSVEHSAKAGYHEDALVRATNGTFALGTALSGWRDGPPGFLPFGDVGAPMGPIAFHQLVARLRHEGERINLSNYALAALCAQSGRFARPKLADRSVLSTLDYGLHVNTAGYRGFMRADALARGVSVRAGQITTAERSSDGMLNALLTDQGDAIRCDFVIDALGPSTLLGQEFESWGAWFPFNQAVTSLCATEESPLPFSHIEADAAGWRRFIPLQGASGELSVSQKGSTIGQPFTPGRRVAPWQHNCVAIGGAATVIDPIAGMQLDLVQSAIGRLIGLLPNDPASTAGAAEYNRQTIEELDGARDVASMFYKGNGRNGDSAWDAVREMPVPERLAHKIALFESCGRTALYDGELVDEAGWVALFEALGIRARRYDALADGLERVAIDTHVARIRDVMLRGVAALPPHADYLRAICA